MKQTKYVAPLGLVRWFYPFSYKYIAALRLKENSVDKHVLKSTGGASYL